MDTGIESYRAIIERVLTEYAKYPYSHGEIERQLVFDRERDHYLLLSVGWHKSRVHGCVIHIDLIDGKCWIQRDGSDSGIALDLEAAGAGSASVASALAALETNVKAYVQTAGTFVPGPLATLLLLAHASGIDPGSFGGLDVTTTLATTERVAPIVAPAPAPTTAPTTPTLPMTGASDVRPIGSVAALLVGLGVAALAVSRRRTRAPRG